MTQFRSALKTPAGSDVEEFLLGGGRYTNFTRETFFLRCPDSPDLRQALQAWQEGGRVFLPALQGPPPGSDIARYTALYGGRSLPFRFVSPIWQEAFEGAWDQVLALFKKVRGRSEEAIVRNFAVKLLYWTDLYFPRLFTETAKMTRFPKFACGGTVKLAEYLFLYLLFLLGCDVLYLSPGGDPPLDPHLLALSIPILSPVIRPAPAGQPAPPAAPAAQETPPPAGEPAGGRVVISMDRVRRPERHAVPAGPAPVPPPPVRPASPGRPATPPAISPPPRSPVVSGTHPGRARQALEFEELARFASSVVMLKVFDQNDQCFKSGSGVIISSQGYVLTNLHVVNGGRYYGILLEEETNVFYTNELIKYHQDYDLAVLRMDKRRQPIPISAGGQKLVRGQKVVAIGSPLGLFNTVSNGIISGFRQLEKVSMIQFTAPVSHGSSGGALLDMYGELIGLITAGYDDGQNLNLAVDCETIYRFVRNLL